jgi:hypothetical protein
MAVADIHRIGAFDEHHQSVDALGEVLKCVERLNRQHYLWSVFDLDWLQRKDGLLYGARVTERSEERPSGWRVDMHGISFFHSQCMQVVDGIFLADKNHIPWPENISPESLMQQAAISLRALDSSYWDFSSRDPQIEGALLEAFQGVRRI